MIKNSKSSNKATSSKGDSKTRMGGSKGNGSSKGIRHGIGGRQLSSTEHDERMGHCSDNGSMTYNCSTSDSSYQG